MACAADDSVPPVDALQGPNTCTQGQYISAAVRSYDGFVTQRTYYRYVR